MGYSKLAAGFWPALDPTSQLESSEDGGLDSEAALAVIDGILVAWRPLVQHLIKTLPDIKLSRAELRRLGMPAWKAAGPRLQASSVKGRHRHIESTAVLSLLDRDLATARKSAPRDLEGVRKNVRDAVVVAGLGVVGDDSTDALYMVRAGFQMVNQYFDFLTEAADLLGRLCRPEPHGAQFWTASSTLTAGTLRSVRSCRQGRPKANAVRPYAPEAIFKTLRGDACLRRLFPSACSTADLKPPSAVGDNQAPPPGGVMGFEVGPQRERRPRAEESGGGEQSQSRNRRCSGDAEDLDFGRPHAQLVDVGSRPGRFWISISAE